MREQPLFSTTPPEAALGYPLWQRALQSGAKLLFRVRDNQVFAIEQALDDGSYLSELFENPKARRHGQGVRVRVIEYQLQGSAEVYRLVTNWLDETKAPAVPPALED